MNKRQRKKAKKNRIRKMIAKWCRKGMFSYNLFISDLASDTKLIDELKALNDPNPNYQINVLGNWGVIPYETKQPKSEYGMYKRPRGFFTSDNEPTKFIIPPL